MLRHTMIFDLLIGNFNSVTKGKWYITEWTPTCLSQLIEKSLQLENMKCKQAAIVARKLCCDKLHKHTEQYTVLLFNLLQLWELLKHYPLCGQCLCKIMCPIPGLPPDCPILLNPSHLSLSSPWFLEGDSLVPTLYLVGLLGSVTSTSHS